MLISIIRLTCLLSRNRNTVGKITINLLAEFTYVFRNFSYVLAVNWKLFSIFGSYSGHFRLELRRDEIIGAPQSHNKRHVLYRLTEVNGSGKTRSSKVDWQRHPGEPQHSITFWKRVPRRCASPALYPEITRR